jgi:hypothetical protein
VAEAPEQPFTFFFFSFSFRKKKILERNAIFVKRIEELASACPSHRWSPVASPHRGSTLRVRRHLIVRATSTGRGPKGRRRGAQAARA